MPRPLLYLITTRKGGYPEQSQQSQAISCSEAKRENERETERLTLLNI